MFFDLLSSFVTAAGDITKGNAAQSASLYNARIDSYNQSVAVQQGQIAQMQVERQATEFIGENISRAGASGFSSTRGSAADVLAASMYNASIDASTAKYNYDVRAKAYGMEANLQRQQAGYESQAGFLNASSDLLTGYSRGVRDQYLDSSSGYLPFRIGG